MTKLLEEKAVKRRPCVICGGPASVEQIDSSIGVLVSVECADSECNGYMNNGWYQDLERAESAWNHRQIGEAAMSAVLPLALSSQEQKCEACGGRGKIAYEYGDIPWHDCPRCSPSATEK